MVPVDSVKIIKQKAKDRTKRHNGASFRTDLRASIILVRGRDRKAVKSFCDRISLVIDCKVISHADLMRGKEVRFVLDKIPVFVYTDGYELDSLENIESLANEINSAYNKKGELVVNIMLHDVEGVGMRSESRAFEYADNEFFMKFDSSRHGTIIHRFLTEKPKDHAKLGQPPKGKEWYEV